MAQNASGPEYLDIDLGEHEAGKAYTLSIGAENVNCTQPLDFRFSSKTSWLHLPADPVVHQVPAGESRQIQMTLDLAHAAPGRHEAFIDVNCDNCGFFIFKNCKIDKQQLRLIVSVNAAPAPPPPPPGQKGQILSPQQPPQIDYNDKRIPKRLRNKAKAALPAPSAAQTLKDVEAQRKKVQDCSRKLGQLLEAQRLALEAMAKLGAMGDNYESDLKL